MGFPSSWTAVGDCDRLRRADHKLISVGQAGPASLDAIKKGIQRGPEASACALALVLTGWASGIRLKAVGSSHRLSERASGIALPGAFSYPRLTELVTRVVASSSRITSLLAIE